MKTRKFYAGYCQYGTNVSYDSLGGTAWKAYAFNSKKDRDEWLKENEYDARGNVVAEPISQKLAYKLAGVKSKVWTLVIDEDNSMDARRF